MAWPPVLGKLYVSLQPTDNKITVTGHHREYQWFVTFKPIQEFGNNTQVYVQHETLTGAHGRIPVIARMLH
jgi:hypothetical protein